MLWKTSYVRTYIAWEILVHKSCSWSKRLFKHLFYEVHFSLQWLLFFIYFYISFNKKEKKKGEKTWTFNMSHTLLIARPCKILTLLNGCIKHAFILKMLHTSKLYRDSFWGLTGDEGIKTKQPQSLNIKPDVWLHGILQAGQAEPRFRHLERISLGLPSPVAEGVTTWPRGVATHWTPC